MSTIWNGAPKNTEAVYRHLTRQASLMRVEFYGEIAAAIAEAEGRQIAPISLRFPLGFIRDEICRRRGLPWLNALAVNDSSWLPGDSFLPEGAAFGHDEQVLWRGAVLSVFAYPWETVDLETDP
jgi:hypothetical protein